MRGEGASNGKSGGSGAVEGSSSNAGCDRKCIHGTQARLAHKHKVNQKIAERNAARAEASNSTNSAGVAGNNTNKNSSSVKKNDKQKKC